MTDYTEELIRKSICAEYLQETIDIILEMLEKNTSFSSYDDSPKFIRYNELSELYDILKYRHPDEFNTMIERARARMEMEKKEDEEDGE